MSTIATKTFPSFKTLYKNLTKELLTIQNASGKIHAAKDLEKQQAMLQYKKLTLIKQGKDFKEVDAKLKQLASGEFEDAKVLEQSALLKLLVEGDQTSKADLNHMSNVVTFLKSQRTYTELIERYNPGLKMSQEENVRKTANRVGLSVPE
ncbi:uncharacterized protein CANTADRAFT_92477 [Suhomyces tanzawaensis NRRL Y-17324]|uniref:ATP synthase assembly factor FMC1, mitochondrial n=1 Tax=Suhomyces tanzawaensis NRRL Y-17324 TaxID=984487 RepID=A0A1E4SBQ5_9ASCO|nr:uncharacterized protein CANTADRAFT_92477 [Suhomyces tanzawaensis NRRL Y-17324]ODV76908.1 hypothetical protein CANTADRAFT_92477 [Suhomyces tanzawaensis NRRL Y-17324]